MRRVLLIIVSALLLGVAALWWFRVQLITALFSALLTRYSPLQVDFELSGLDRSRVSFPRISLPALNLTVRNVALGISESFSDGSVQLLKGAEADYSDSSLKLRGALLEDLKLSWSKATEEILLGSARIALSGTRLKTPSFSLDCQDCDLSIAGGAASPPGYNLRGALELRKFQSSIRAGDGKEILESLHLGVQLRRRGANTSLSFEELKGRLFGGEIKLGEISPGTVPQGCWVLPLKVERVDLARILELYPESKIIASGTVSGTVPFFYCHAGWYVAGADLRSDGGGNIKMPESPHSGSEQADFAFRALRDFDYSTLKALCSMKADGKIDLALKVEGTSKSLGQGTPLVLNLNLEENLWELLKSIQLIRH